MVAIFKCIVFSGIKCIYIYHHHPFPEFASSFQTVISVVFKNVTASFIRL